MERHTTPEGEAPTIPVEASPDKFIPEADSGVLQSQDDATFYQSADGQQYFFTVTDADGRLFTLEFCLSYVRLTYRADGGSGFSNNDGPDPSEPDDFIAQVERRQANADETDHTHLHPDQIGDCAQLAEAMARSPLFIEEDYISRHGIIADPEGLGIEDHLPAKDGEAEGHWILTRGWFGDISKQDSRGIPDDDYFYRSDEYDDHDSPPVVDEVLTVGGDVVNQFD